MDQKHLFFGHTKKIHAKLILRGGRGATLTVSLTVKYSFFDGFPNQDREHFLKRDVQFEENNLAGGSMVAGADRKVQKTGNSSL